MVAEGEPISVVEWSLSDKATKTVAESNRKQVTPTIAVAFVMLFAELAHVVLMLFYVVYLSTRTRINGQ